MNILVACEESQRVCKAFREKGHNAFSCDIQSCSGGYPEWHIKGDVLQYINGASDDFRCPDLLFYTEDGSTHFLPCRWDMLIAFPPCTYLTNAGHCRLNEPGRIEKMKAAKEFFLELYNADIEKIAIENPVPMKICNLPGYSQIIQPYEFGENYKKRTCFWLKNLPPLIGNCIGKSTEYESWTMKTRSAAKRAKTFEKVAQAMAKQWGRL